MVLLVGLSACSEVKQPTDQVNNDTKTVPNNIASGTTVLDVRCPNSSFTRSIANGITFYAGNYRADNAGKRVVNFCFDQIDTGDWIINESHIVDRQGLNAYLSETELLETRFPPTIIDGEMKQEILDLRGGRQDVKHYHIAAEPDRTVGQHFVSVIYDLPPEFDLINFTVVVDSIHVVPTESELCSNIHIAKLQQKLDEMQTGIKIKLRTDQYAGGGMCGYHVVEKPENMSFEEAMSIVGKIDLYGIRDPWVFWGSVK